MKSKDSCVCFHIDESTHEVSVEGVPELENLRGLDGGEGMAFFFGKGPKNYEFVIANTTTRQWRKMSSQDGALLVGNEEIDYDAIHSTFRQGCCNVDDKVVRYAGLNRWDGFKDGVCAISWVLYPDGRYFEDNDGFGSESHGEETVYAIINTDLEIVVPFRPMADVAKILKMMRKSLQE